MNLILLHLIFVEIYNKVDMTNNKRTETKIYAKISIKNSQLNFHVFLTCHKSATIAIQM